MRKQNENRILKTSEKSLSLALSHLGGLDSGHFLSPALCRLRFPDGAEVIGGKPRNAHVVVTLQYELDVANLECRRRAKFGKPAGRGDNVIDKVVGHLKDKL